MNRKHHHAQHKLELAWSLGPKAPDALIDAALIKDNPERSERSHRTMRSEFRRLVDPRVRRD